MKAPLRNGKGQVLHNLDIPGLTDRAPEIIVWAGRYFALDKRDGNYYEAMVYFTDRHGI